MPIAEGDQGSFVVVYPGDQLKPTHRECSLRSIAGSPEHLRKICRCYGGTAESSASTPEERRAEAILVFQMWKVGFR